MDFEITEIEIDELRSTLPFFDTLLDHINNSSELNLKIIEPSNGLANHEACQTLES